MSNFHTLEVLGRGSEIQVQVGENAIEIAIANTIKLSNWRTDINYWLNCSVFLFGLCLLRPFPLQVLKVKYKGFGIKNIKHHFDAKTMIYYLNFVIDSNLRNVLSEKLC